jgi:GAF domain-containing protein
VGYFSIIRVTWDDSSYGQEVVDAAIKTGQPALLNDIGTDQRALPWRQEARQRGYTSSMALPLFYEGKTFSALCAYSDKKQALGVEEVEFLNSVADDIAVGVRFFRPEQGMTKGVIKLQSS